MRHKLSSNPHVALRSLSECGSKGSSLNVPYSHRILHLATEDLTIMRSDAESD